MNMEIVSNGFGGKVVRTELTLLIEVLNNHGTVSYRIHLFHGTPAYADWYKNREPIATVKDIVEARRMVDRLGGLVDAHKHFPSVLTTWK
jgi:hypothetical protein